MVKSFIAKTLENGYKNKKFNNSNVKNCYKLNSISNSIPNRNIANRNINETFITLTNRYDYDQTTGFIILFFIIIFVILFIMYYPYRLA